MKFLSRPSITRNPNPSVPLAAVLEFALDEPLETRVEIALHQGDEIIELFSHAFFEDEEFSEEQRNMALLVGKGNFDVPPLSEQKKAGSQKKPNPKI